MTSKIIWSIKELTEVMRNRQLNKFDVNFGVSGKRGDGKSTLLFKIFHAFKSEGFRNRKHQVYSRDDVINLLSAQKFGFCWDDEAINSGYKREFQKTGQIDLIKLVTNYRDNYNMYGSALPFFYSLDKALRELMFMHIHIIERGMAVIFLPLTDVVHSQDPWDSANNIKIEQRETKRVQNNPKLRFRYEKFTTFGGYLYFGPMTEKQEKMYKAIKESKRAKAFEDITKKTKEPTFIEKTYDALLERKLTREGLIQACYLNKCSFTDAIRRLNQMLRDNAILEKASSFLKDDELTGVNNELTGVNTSKGGVKSKKSSLLNSNIKLPKDDVKNLVPDV